jgi:hypothetical protein
MGLSARKRLRLWRVLALMLIVLNVVVTVSGLY